jgi:hypothetical protein
MNKNVKEFKSGNKKYSNIKNNKISGKNQGDYKGSKKTYTYENTKTYNDDNYYNGGGRNQNNTYSNGNYYPKGKLVKKKNYYENSGSNYDYDYNYNYGHSNYYQNEEKYGGDSYYNKNNKMHNNKKYSNTTYGQKIEDKNFTGNKFDDYSSTNNFPPEQNKAVILEHEPAISQPNSNIKSMTVTMNDLFDNLNINAKEFVPKKFNQNKFDLK